MGIAAPVTSPTYTLIHELDGPVPLFHADPYRLETPEQAQGFGFEEYFERGGVMVIEWADRVLPLLPLERLTLHLTMESDTENTSESGEIGAKIASDRDESSTGNTLDSGKITTENAFDFDENIDNVPRLLTVKATGTRYVGLLEAVLSVPELRGMHHPMPEGAERRA